MTPEQVKQAQAAISAYRSYWDVVDRAVADPGKDWSSEMATVATGQSLDLAMEDFAQTAASGQRAAGTTMIEPVVTQVEPALVTLNVCVDKSATDFLDANGNSIKAPNAPGSYVRHVSTAKIGEFNPGQWLVISTSDDWTTTC